MGMGVEYKEDCKKIIDEINELPVWDKGELLTYFVNNLMTEDEIEKYFIEGSGYIKWDDIDFVKGVLDKGQEYEVMDEMTEYDILNYLLGSFNDNASYNLRDWLERMDGEDIADAFSKMKFDCLKDAFKYLYTNDAEKFIEIFKYLSDLR